MNLCDPQALRALLARHNFHFSRSLGQNFLTDPDTLESIAAASGAGPGWGVLEIGPGVGSLSARLCRRGARVAAVEADRALYPILAETMAEFEHFTLIPGDALKLDLAALAAEQFPGLRPMACANLPYNITTAALTALAEAACFEVITVMVQKEAAERILARPGSRDYGVFPLLMAYHTEPEILFEVPPDRFYPAPRVTSAVLRCPVRRTPPVSPACGKKFLFAVIKAAFAQRRKTLVNALAAAWPLDKGTLASLVTSLGLPEDARGERLTLEEFAALADALAETAGGTPPR